MMAPRIDPAVIPGAIANRMLEREAWARQRLAAHAGRVFIVAIGPAATVFAVDGTGRVSSTLAADAAPDLTLRLSPLDLPAFLANPTRWDRYVKADGDAALATTLKDLAPTMPWLVEQAFAKVLGEVAGQRLADTGRRLLAFPEYAAERIGDSIVGYAREQSGLLVTADEGSAFAAQVAELVSQADALAARVDALAERLSATVVPAQFGKKKDFPA
jgi:ubiquinone biosynthesis accessory factor UbiJ